jgi:hypothetical protein
VPVEFLTDEEVAGYGTYSAPLTRRQLETLFFLDDEDRALVGKRRGDHMRMRLRPPTRDGPPPRDVPQ